MKEHTQLDLFKFFEEPSLWYWLVYISLVSATVLHMLYQRRTPQSLTTWLLTIILLPYIGILLYLLFGLRKSFSKRHKAIITQQPMTTIEKGKGIKSELDALMNANHIAGTTVGNKIDLIYDGVDAFETLILLIEQAQQRIYLETYIFENDATGHAIIEALCKKANQGIDVKLLMDAIGSFDLYVNSKPLKKLKQAGGQYAFFQPIWPNIITNQINLRNHRKIYLFDERTVLTGGVNLSDDYLGADSDKTRWLDLLFKIEGSACSHYQTIFNEDWHFTTNEKNTPKDTSSPEKSENTEANTNASEILQAMPSGPDIESDTFYEALLLCIHSAKHSIQIATPYFIPNNNVMNALMIAIKRGVEIKVLTPTKSDHWIFDFGRSSYMRELSEVGGNLKYYPHNMLHAKLIIFDENYALSGSANFDYRSLFLNYEMVHFLHCEKTIKSLSEWFNHHFNDGVAYEADNSKSTLFIENISRVIAPIL